MEKQFQSMQQFKFQEQFQAVRSLVDQNNEPWFIAKDVAEILGYRDAHNATRYLEDDEKGTLLQSTVRGEKDVIIINESGLYNLIFKSEKPQAKTFRKWVTSEVLPAIRKQGHYGFAQKPQIPTDPEQAWGMWAYLTKQERVLSAQIRTIRTAKSACLTLLQNSAPPYIVPDTLQVGLFPQ